MDEAVITLDRAHAAGVRMIDTARAYGKSERVLAQCAAGKRFDIITKCPDLRDSRNPEMDLEAAFEASCQALRVSHLYGYLLHNPDDLDRPGVWEVLARLRDAGRVRRIGVSGYDPKATRALCERYPITLIQLPANVLDPWYESVIFPPTVELHTRLPNLAQLN